MTLQAQSEKSSEQLEAEMTAILMQPGGPRRAEMAQLLNLEAQVQDARGREMSDRVWARLKAKSPAEEAT